MYLKTTIWNTPNRDGMTHHRTDDDYIVVHYNDGYYSLDTNDGVAHVRDGLNTQSPGDIDDVPLAVLLYVREELGIEVAGSKSVDILDVDASTENCEVYV